MSREAQQGGASLWRGQAWAALWGLGRSASEQRASARAAAPAARAGLQVSACCRRAACGGDACPLGHASPLCHAGAVGTGHFDEGDGGVARVEQDGWEKAAAANVWSGLMSEGFFLLKSANNLLLSTASAAGKGGGREEVRAERAEAVKALLIALARFEAVLRLFGGRCYNTDLARNLGLACWLVVVRSAWLPCLYARVRPCACMCDYVSATACLRHLEFLARVVSGCIRLRWRCCLTRQATGAGLGYALLSDLVAQAASEAGHACARRGAGAGARGGHGGKTHDRELDPSVSWLCALSRLSVHDCKDAAHAALSVFLHSVEHPDADVVARIVERSRSRLLCLVPLRPLRCCVPEG